MRLYKTFLIISLFAYPMIAFGAGETVSTLKSDILNATTLGDAKTKLDTAVETLATFEDYKDNKVSDETKAEAEKRITSASTEISENAAKGPSDTRTAEEKKQALEDAKKKYKDAKATEQSTANKTMTALTTAATGIGGMELAMGLSEQKADKDAEDQMNAYIETMRCTYGGKQVKAGPEEVELPGGNDETIMKLRNEYVALAASLKERKEALGMKPGIESEEILDKATMGLYDDESVGINGGAYESLYRAKMLGSEEDQTKIDANKKASKNRVIAGGVLAGVGVAGGIIGNSAINGKLGELIKKAKDNKEIGTETEKALKVETDALEDLQNCLDKAGVNNTSALSFENFYVSALSIKKIHCKNDLSTLADGTKANTKSAIELFVDSADSSEVLDKLIESFGPVITGKMIGTTLSEDPTTTEKENAINVLKKSQAAAKKRIDDAKKADEAAAAGSSGSGSTDTSGILNTLTSKLGAGQQTE